MQEPQDTQDKKSFFVKSTNRFSANPPFVQGATNTFVQFSNGELKTRRVLNCSSDEEIIFQEKRALDIGGQD